jgi:UDP-N-acetylglucosamine pyrophosphorylase
LKDWLRVASFFDLFAVFRKIGMKVEHGCESLTKIKEKETARMDTGSLFHHHGLIALR